MNAALAVLVWAFVVATVIGLAGLLAVLLYAARTLTRALRGTR